MPALGALAGSWTAAAGLAAFLVLAVLETHRPWDVGTAAGSRWVTNLVLYGAVVGLLALVAPQHWAGVILEGWDSGPLAWVAGHCGAWAVLAAGLLLMDALAYGLHRMQHLRLFWPLHAIHHADAQVDVTTGLRHHPGEALVNGLVGAALLAVLGLPPWVATVYGLAAIVWMFGATPTWPCRRGSSARCQPLWSRPACTASTIARIPRTSARTSAGY